VGTAVWTTGWRARQKSEEVTAVFGRRRNDVREQAAAARGEAAVAFSALDRLQRQVVDRVTFAAHVDGSARGQALFDRARVASAGADAAAAEWLAVRRVPPPPHDADQAANEQLADSYRVCRSELDEARQTFERLLVEIGAALGEIEVALVAVPARVETARHAIRDAEAAVDAQRRVGLAPEAAEEALARVQRRARVLDEGPAVHGITETLAAAAEVAHLAGEARRLAEELPHRRDDMARRLVSMRTRLEAVESKGGRLESALAALQVAYVEESWSDLAEAPVHFDDILNDAADRLGDAESAARRLAYPEALRLLEEVRSALTRADEQVRHVTERLAALDVVVADPDAPLGPVQLALDEARRVNDAHAPELKALAARLEEAPKKLDHEGADYFGYLHELDAIKVEIAALRHLAIRG
jgi:hypothetical protein